MSLRLRITLVGCGKAGENHVSQIQHIPEADLVAVCDREPIMAEQLGSRYGVRQCYSDYCEMLEKERPDVVHITAPPQVHFGLAAMAFESGSHVLIEKPATCSHTTTEQLVSMAEAAGRKLTVAWGHYFDPIARDMRQLVQSAAIGEVVHLNSHFGYDLTGPFGRPVLTDRDHWVRELPAQVIYNVADHIFNKICEYLPSDDPAIETMIWPGQSASSPDEMPSEMRVLIKDDRVTASAIFSSGMRPVLHRFQVFGTKGSTSLDFTSGVLSIDRRPRHRGTIGALLSGYEEAWRRFRYANRNMVRMTKGEFGYFSGLQYLIRSFYRSIVRDDPVPIPHDLILKVSRLTDRVLLHPKGAGCKEKLIV
jgi:predicted dehydrogenase